MRKALMLMLCMVLLLGSLARPAVAHADEWTSPVTKLPNCTEEGYTWQQNKVTMEIRRYNFLPAFGHDWDYDNPEVLEAPTCTRFGRSNIPCKNNWLLQVVPHSTTVMTNFLGHDWKDWVVDPEPTCETEGMRIRECRRDLTHGQMEVLPAKGHLWSGWVTRKDPTAAEEGMEERVCIRDKSHVEQRVIPALSDPWERWLVHYAPTCDAEGQELRRLKADATQIETRVIPALGHDWKPWVVELVPTCDAEGRQVRECRRDSTHREVQVMPALGHDWEPWVVNPKPTCLTDGTRMRTCKNDAAHKEAVLVSALGHAWQCTITKAATCTAKGEQSCVCQRDNTHVMVMELPMTAHQPQWKQTKAPTYKAEGERKQICKVCGTELAVEAIPMLTRSYRANDTMCALGLRFRDVAPGSMKEWYMFTPLDLSKEGEQSFPLIASNAYVMGSMKVKVAEGQVTVSYEVLDGAKVNAEYLTFYADVEAALAADPAKLGGKNFPMGQPISIADDLEGDTKVLLLLCNRVAYYDDLKGLSRYFPWSPDNAKLLEEMKALVKQR